MTVFVTVNRSEAEADLLLDPPLKSATSKRMNTAPPATHNQGDVYQVVVSFVVTVVVVDPPC